MRNSLMPMILVVIVVAVSLALLNSKSNPGLNGPDLQPGIFRLPKKDKFHVDSAALIDEDVVTAEGVPPANRGESWRVVLVIRASFHLYDPGSTSAPSGWAACPIFQTY